MFFYTILYAPYLRRYNVKRTKKKQYERTFVQLIRWQNKFEKIRICIIFPFKLVTKKKKNTVLL